MPKRTDISSILIVAAALVAADPAHAQADNSRTERVGEWRLTDAVRADGGRDVSMARTLRNGTAEYLIVGPSRRRVRLSSEGCEYFDEFAAAASSAQRPPEIAAKFAGLFAMADASCGLGSPGTALSAEELARPAGVLEGWIGERPLPDWMAWTVARGSTDAGAFGYGVSRDEQGIQILYLVPANRPRAGELHVRMPECRALWDDVTQISPADAAAAARAAGARLARFSGECGYNADLSTRLVRGLAEAFARLEAAERAGPDSD